MRLVVKLSHDSVKLIKFADDTTLIGLISNNDESAYRREVDRLVSWCSGNNLELNAQKTVEMTVDFRKSTVPPPPPSVMDSPITSVESFRFLGTTITQDLKWEPTISSLIKKAQQRMYFLRQLRKAKLQFYTAIIESIITSSTRALTCHQGLSLNAYGLSVVEDHGAADVQYAMHLLAC
uniref:Reverse transcriptase domain-containing protein n=1 Tax=Knipowitschia caucasica TaxID=637954 RepID=A0AAV2IYG4_KNICA